MYLSMGHMSPLLSSSTRHTRAQQQQPPVRPPPISLSLTLSLPPAFHMTCKLSQRRDKNVDRRENNDGRAQSHFERDAFDFYCDRVGDTCVQLQWDPLDSGKGKHISR